MGAFLDKPETEKKTTSSTTPDGMPFAVSCMQGWRTHMEDAHVMVPLEELPNTSFFAVFDGHGGKTVALTSQSMIVNQIRQTEYFKNGDKSPEALGKALQKGLIDLDEAVKKQVPALEEGHDRSGSTVIAAFLTPTHIIIGNCGDSRAMVARSGAVRFASKDHKPGDPGETARIKAAGGFVEMGRVCGNLAVSRALGDYEFKDQRDLGPEQQKITCLADVEIIERSPSDSFLIMACDGIWDVVSNAGMVVFVTFYLERGRQVHEIVELLLDYCLDLGSKDNMSVALVLLPGHPKPDPSKVPPPSETPEQVKARLARERQELDAAIKQVPGIDNPAAWMTPPPVFAPPAPREHDSDDEESMDTDGKPRRRPSSAEAADGSAKFATNV